MEIDSVEDLSNIINVSILDSGFRAVLNISDEEPVEGKLSYDKLIEFLKKKNVDFGLNEIKLKDICDHPKEYIGIEEEIARGLMPTNGKDGWIDWKVKIKSNEGPKLLENGSVDYHNLNKIINIKKGDLLAIKIPGTKGIPGKSISSKDIAAKNGKDVLFKVGKNVLINPNKDKLYAGIDGQLVFTDKDKINIFPIYEVVGDVDFGIGNIDFVGTVIVKGNVPDGFKIRADGEIKVYGNVDGAELIAEGDIYIQHGIIGHNKSSVDTKGKLTVAFILDSDVKASDEIIVSKSIMHSIVSSGDKVVCQSDKGIIVGGEIHAANSVVAKCIGNEHTTMTIIEVGINQALKNEMRENRKEKKELDIILDKIEKGLLLFNKMENENGMLNPEKKEMKEEFLKQSVIIKKKVKEIKEREFLIDEKLKEIKNANIEVKDIIYPGVKIIIGKTVKFIKEEIKYAKFVLDDNEDIIIMK